MSTLQPTAALPMRSAFQGRDILSGHITTRSAAQSAGDTIINPKGGDLSLGATVLRSCLSPKLSQSGQNTLRA